MVFLYPYFEKLEGHIAFGLCVRESVLASVRHIFDACHILWTVHASILKFQFSCPSYLLFWTYALLKKVRMKSCEQDYLKEYLSYVLETWSTDRRWWVDYSINFWSNSFTLFGSYGPSEIWEILKIVSKISRKVFELGAWNLVSL